MKVIPSARIREIDQYTIEHEPIASIDLMERAATRLNGWYVRHLGIDRKVIVVAGPGNNGGDALALARMLAERQYQVVCFVIDLGRKMSKDCSVNLERLQKQGRVKSVMIREKSDLPEIGSGDVVVDGIFGSGLSRVAEGFPAEVIAHINRSGATVVSVDIPSGLFGEDNTNNRDEGIIRADYTLTFQFPFLSFFFTDYAHCVGQWRVLDIGLHPEITRQTETAYETISRESVSSLFPARNSFSHKGTFGHALVIAGSYGMMGAALLTTKAALRSGAGLVTLHLPKSGYTIAQTAIPEAIVSIDQSEILFSRAPDLSLYGAVGVGPGIGTRTNTGKGLEELLERVSVPLVIDADALNILAGNKPLLDKLPRGTVLTPHPGEFDRLAGPSKTGYERHMKQLEFSERYGVLVVLKGNHTGISTPGGKYWINRTGNPGMATGGSGDVLTGIIVSLLATGLPAEEACMAGVYLHGLAGDIARDAWGEESLIAGDITDSLGKAFLYMKNKPFLHERRFRGGVIRE